jgi:Bacterial low temperature requirement A protein (LtrA)
MTSPAQSVQRDAVSPLELFFDLVFVFAVSQLSHHLLDHLTWRGAAETLVLLIAVFGIWSGTSFEARSFTSPGLRREHIQRELQDRSGRQQPGFSPLPAHLPPAYCRTP